MEVTKEQENYYRLISLLNECIVPRLHELFIEAWNRQFPTKLWPDSSDNPKDLLTMIKGGSRDALLKKRILQGKVEDWDFTCVSKALLALKMQPLEIDCIDKLKNARNMISHPFSGKFSDKDKDDIFIEVNDVYDKFNWPKDAVKKFEHGNLTTDYVKQLKAKLEDERRAALKENQDNLCKLPEEVRNFVGREEQLQQASEIFDLDNDKTSLIITGGPCYGKSSLAVKIGYEMYDNGYSYVIWINMRDITRNPKNPSLDDVAFNILQQFNIDTSQMKDKIVEYLKRKLEMIADRCKSALLIFDNADSLIEPKGDESCQSSAFERLCQMIRDTKGNSIRCIFTSRICKNLIGDRHQQMELGYLSDAESRCFVNRELQEFSFQHKDTLIEDLLVAGHGLPYALKLVCSEVITMEGKEMIEDYVNDVKENPLDTLDDDLRLTRLFDISYKRLNENEQGVFTALAVFPSTFSYRYLSKVLDNVERINLKPRLLNTLIKHSLVCADSGRYWLHPFLREFLKNNYWDDDCHSKYEIAYYTTYINKLFELAGESLEKNRFLLCQKEFLAEQQNFLYVMRAVGKGSAISKIHLRNLLKDGLKNLSTPEHISVVLFLCHEVYSLYSVALIEFFKGCETFVEGQMKKNIWCCRFDVNMAISETRIDEDYIELNADEFGKILVAKRKCYQTGDPKEFRNAVSCLQNYLEWAEKLNNCKMKAYFTASILIAKVRLLKKTSLSWSFDIDKTRLIADLEQALDICKSTFGMHWLTIDCYTQLGKLYWAFNYRDAAIVSFDSAVVMAESFSINGNRKYLSCLVNKGRFLADSGSKEYIEEGKALIDKALESCKDDPDEIMWLLAMKTLVQVDKKKREEMANMFLKEQGLSHRWLQIMKGVFTAELFSPDEDVNNENFIDHETRKVERLLQMIEHLEYLSKKIRQDDKNLLHAAVKELYIRTVLVGTECMHVLSESDTVKLLSKALTILRSHKFINQRKRNELYFIINCDKDRSCLLKRKCYIIQLMNRIPGVDQQREIQKLLNECMKYEDVYSIVSRELEKFKKGDMRK